MAKHPVVSKANVSKSLLGSWKIQFDCPACGGKLTTKSDAIGTVDDCQLCGAQFIVSESVRSQIEQIEADGENQKAEAAQRRKQTELERKAAGRNMAMAQQEELAQRQREHQEREDNRGYDYPNLKIYQSYIELLAKVGAGLFALLAAACLIWGIVQVAAGSRIAMLAFAYMLVFAVSGIVWYLSTMISAEIIRLVVTVALDVRAIRDRMRDGVEE